MNTLILYTSVLAAACVLVGLLLCMRTFDVSTTWFIPVLLYIAAHQTVVSNVTERLGIAPRRAGSG